jgi:hypothetical protein
MISPMLCALTGKAPPAVLDALAWRCADYREKIESGREERLSVGN